MDLEREFQLLQDESVQSAPELSSKTIGKLNDEERKKYESVRNEREVQFYTFSNE